MHIPSGISVIANEYDCEMEKLLLSDKSRVARRQEVSHRPDTSRLNGVIYLSHRHILMMLFIIIKKCIERKKNRLIYMFICSFFVRYSRGIRKVEILPFDKFRNGLKVSLHFIYFTKKKFFSLSNFNSTHFPIIIILMSFMIQLYGKFSDTIFISFISFVVIVALAVPELDPFISLVGAIFFSVLGISIPAVVETISCWESHLGTFKWRLWKNSLLLLFSLLALIFGTWISILDIIKLYR